MSLRVLFAGTPSIACPSLELLSGAAEVVAVLTAPDTGAGRGREPKPSDVKQAALKLGLPVLQPEKLDAGFREVVAALKPGLLVCVAYGKIFGPKFLALFPKGGINLHPSLLPKYRGPSPLSAAILAGDAETGISVQRLALEMDSGDLLAQRRVPLTGRETAASLGDLCGRLGAELLLEAVRDIEAGRDEARPQDREGVSFCRLVSKEDGRIDWTKAAVVLDREVRAYDPWPRAWTSWQGQALSVLEAEPFPGSTAEPGARPALPPGTVSGVDKKHGFLVQTGAGLLALKRLQLQSKKAMDFQAFYNGARNFVGSVLGA